MNIKIQYEKCLTCECCVSACRRYIFKLGDQGKIEIDPQKIALCMHCGHCSAVCPGNAIELDGVSSGSLEELPVSLGINPEQLMMFLKSKRSIGAYSSRTVPQELLEKALDAANYAPSARGAHPVRWLVVCKSKQRKLLLEEMLHFYASSTDKTARSHYENSLNGIDSLLRSAPCILLAYAPKHVYGESDCVCAAMYASLALHAQGIASCWAGSILAVAKEGILKSLPIPQEYKIYAALMVGYSDVNFRKLPHRPRPVITIL